MSGGRVGVNGRCKFAVRQEFVSYIQSYDVANRIEGVRPVVQRAEGPMTILRAYNFANPRMYGEFWRALTLSTSARVIGRHSCAWL